MNYHRANIHAATTLAQKEKIPRNPPSCPVSVTTTSLFSMIITILTANNMMLILKP